MLTQPSILFSTKNLSQAYLKRITLKNITLALNSSEIILLTGPNGAGKTTLLKVIAGLLKPLRGELKRNKKVSDVNLFLPDGSLYLDLTLKENLDFYRTIYGTSEVKQKELEEIYHLSPILDRPTRHLSRGQKVRGALCRTLLKDCSLYLFDEPFSGLDEDSLEYCIDHFEILKKQGKCLLIASQQHTRLNESANRILKLDNGQMVI